MSSPKETNTKVPDFDICNHLSICSDSRTTAAKRIDTSSQTVLLFGLEVDYTSRRSLSRKKIRKLLKRTRKIPDSQAESREADFEDLVTPPCDFDWQEDKWKKKCVLGRKEEERESWVGKKRGKRESWGGKRRSTFWGGENISVR
ncbi:uncharacterized protein BCR38DRAFT_476824 [Pseudomassariella vexata]|uniref:Uncharacterized protein n=1 Tax=Pseudomassariella vexata TaxID=1141098 RepID=A0A1Y2DNZ7_9PEZI|nr:uncharacterized protein BCR38DRAFT_476824 [Pseudomassariella vexata]ORY61008.1 hypothetical protein BCR38DRAFT_476824 [Pseudomassariella vexata]